MQAADPKPLIPPEWIEPWLAEFRADMNRGYWQHAVGPINLGRPRLRRLRAWQHDLRERAAKLIAPWLMNDLEALSYDD